MNHLKKSAIAAITFLNLYLGTPMKKTYSQVNNQDKKLEQIEKNKDKKKTFNFLEKIYIQIKASKSQKRNFSKLEELANICDENGKKTYTTKEIIELNHWGVSKEYAELIKVKDENGKNILTKDGLLKIGHITRNDDLTFRKKESSQDIAKFLKYTDEKGKKIFNSDDFLTYRSYNIKLKELFQAIDTKNEKPKEIAKKLYREKVREELKKWSLDSIMGEFIDTEKPNALAIYPYSDCNGVFKEFISGWNHQDFTLGKLKEHYDLKLIFAEKKENAYLIIKKIPNIEFLILCGHGTKKSLSLGSTDKRIYKSEKSEEYSINISDKEFKNYLDMLNSTATIFLYSCENAKKNLFSKKNLARFISKMAENKKVVAWKKLISNEEIYVKNYYPFEIKKDSHGKTEGVYYINGKKKKIK